ncbi:MAG: hypothetical protein BGO01_06320 [Armatimonadetes bacterium 55-13]|nr:TlpA family protein disulfide reductase [Armatimonadota bacterium]OJU65095.1 MAG: hypothetical protein BGO01_06320 [Armatimonadetes bacterium 55-13]
MRHINRFTLIAAALAGSIVAANAAGIGPGSPAPALDVKTWYKGTPVKEFAKDKIYVVEFWATWCGPCKVSIPHLTELAHKNKDVTFIGVSIWEDDNGTNVKQFVDQMGDKMDYNVGYSGNKTGMAVTWMQAASQNGIPSAFIVKNGQIQWVGHPMTMEKPLEEIKAGSFDLKAYKADFDKKAEETRQQMAARTEIVAINKLIDDGKFGDASKKLDEVQSKYPAVAPQLRGIRFSLLAKTDPTAWQNEAKKIAASNDTSPLWQFAMDQTVKKTGGDMANGAIAMDLALNAAKEDDLVVFYYAATFFSKAEDYKKALAAADKALAALPKSEYKDNAQLKAQIEKMRTDLAAKANN